jgi:hypothetical protein
MVENNLTPVRLFSTFCNYNKRIMKKLLSVAAAALLLLCTSFQASAIKNPDPVGSVTANAYLGLQPGIGANASIDYVLINKWWKGHFTVGAYAGFHGEKNTDSMSAAGVEVKNTSRDFHFTVMPRATYGLNITKFFEVHAGTMAGVQFSYNKTKASASSSYGDVGGKEKTSDTSTGFAFSEIVGCRYYLSRNFGVSAEVGYGSVSYLNVGFSFRF